jgi:hypothetical protein
MNNTTNCPCCEQHDFTVPNNYEVCPVCHWRDDLVQRKETDFKGGANELSLNEHRVNWAEIRTQKRDAEIIKLFIERTPLDKIAADVGKSIDTVKSFLIQCGFKEVAN